MTTGRFVEVADRCWVATQSFCEVNVTVVAGKEGLLVVDTGSSTPLAEEVLVAVRELSALPVVAAVNTHAHFDHSFGNGAFAAVGAELVCHEAAAAELPGHAAAVRAEAAADDSAPENAGVAATEPVVPERTFSSVLTLEVGGRAAELVHPGRGHTGGDLVVRVPDADVLLAGDLVEQARGGVPGYGPDSFPLDWPAALDLVLGLLGPQTVVVPGHGLPVGKDFVQEQRADVGVVAQTVRDLAAAGVPVDRALAEGSWPWPAEQLADAVRRGYAALSPGDRRLPLADQRPPAS